MLEASGCCVPPPSPPMPDATTSAQNTGDSAIAISPTVTHTLPMISSQNSPMLSARNPAGTWSTADAPLNTERSSPTSVNDSPMSSLINGRSGTRRAKNKSLHTCIVDPNISVRRERGALVMNETTQFALSTADNRYTILA